MIVYFVLGPSEANDGTGEGKVLSRNKLPVWPRRTSPEPNSLAFRRRDKTPRFDRKVRRAAADRGSMHSVAIDPRPLPRLPVGLRNRWWPETSKEGFQHHDSQDHAVRLWDDRVPHLNTFTVPLVVTPEWM